MSSRKQLDQSNLSAAAFCREHRISYQGFLNWRSRARPAEVKTRPEFIEIEVPPPTATLGNHHSIVELVFPGGLLLRIKPLLDHDPHLQREGLFCPQPCDLR